MPVRHYYGGEDEGAALDEEAIRHFLASDYPALVANLGLVTGSREEAEDAVQEALARAWVRSERGEVIVALRVWVGVVALNVARSRFRRLRAERRATEILSSRALASERWEQAEPGSELAMDTRQLLSRLPRRQREVVLLHYYLDLAIDEIASALRITRGTAKKALFRAREAMARSVGEEEAAVTDVTN
jgi:RNA polymerase sigma factor (sigma-70 family)